MKKDNSIKIEKLTTNNLAEIKLLYANIRNNSFTLWDADYPSDELIKYDISRNGLWGAFKNNQLVGICFAGRRCEDGEEPTVGNNPCFAIFNSIQCCNKLKIFKNGQIFLRRHFLAAKY